MDEELENIVLEETPSSQVSSSAKSLFFAVLFYACAGHFAIDFALGIWPVFKTMAHLDVAFAGIIAGISVIIGEGMQGYFGSLADKGYQKQMLVLGIFLGVFATLYSYFDSYLPLAILFLGTCLGSSAFHPTAASMLGSLSHKNKSIVMAIFTTSGMLGMGVSQLIFSWTHTVLDGQTAILGIPFLILALFVFKSRYKQPPVKTEQHHFSIQFIKKFFSKAPLKSLYFCMLANQTVLWSLVFLLPDFLQAREYDGYIIYGGGHLFLMLGAAVAPPILGFVADKNSARTVIIALMAMTFVSFYALLVLVVLPDVLLFSLLFFLGACLGSIPPLCWSLGSVFVPSARGLVSAFLMGFVWIVSEGCGILTSGVLSSLFTDDAPAKALSIMGAILILGMYYSLKLPSDESQTITLD